MDLLCGKDLTRPFDRLLGKKPSVIPDDDPFLFHLFLFHFPAHRLRQQLNVLPGKLISYDGSPAAGSKVYHSFPFIP